jgi:LemA protein
MKNIGLYVALGLILLVAGCGCGGYNKIVQQDQVVKKSWGNVQNQYQRRTDLIPNLVSTVKGAANFEQTTLTQVIEARAKATSTTIDANNLTPENVQKFQQAQGQLSGAMSRLLVSVENYPDLKANANFQSLMAELAGTENRINAARVDFNSAVETYNTSIKTVPNVFFAGIFGYKEKGFFAAEAGAEKAPSVDFK